MKLSKNYDFLNISKYLPWILALLFIVLLYHVIIIFRSYTVAFFLAIIVYTLFRIPHRWLLIKLNYRKTIAASLMTILVLASFLVPLLILILLIIQEIGVAVKFTKTWLTQDNILQIYQQNLWINNFVDISETQILNIKEDILDYTTSIDLNNVWSTLKFGRDTLFGTIALVSNFLLAMVIVFFLFKGGDKLSLLIYKNLPFPNDVEKILGKRMFAILDAVVKGNLFISILQGFLLGIYLWIFGIPTPVLWGAIGAFFSLIPIVGTSVISIPAMLYLFTQDEKVAGITLVIIAHLSYLALENFLKPLLLDRKLNLHPLILFLTLLGGLTEFGIKGLILGPFLVTIFISLWEIINVWNERYRKNKF